MNLLASKNPIEQPKAPDSAVDMHRAAFHHRFFDATKGGMNLLQDVLEDTTEIAGNVIGRSARTAVKLPIEIVRGAMGESLKPRYDTPPSKN